MILFYILDTQHSSKHHLHPEIADEYKHLFDKKPTLLELLKLPTDSGEPINVLQDIGTEWHCVGIFLLEDSTGVRIDAIQDESRGKSEAINRAILKEWIRGKGMGPSTWTTLIKVLHDCKLDMLAREIEKSVILLEKKQS